MKIIYIKILLLLLLMDNYDNKDWHDNDSNILFNELKQDSYSIKNIALKLNKSEECIEFNINNILNQLINIYEIDINIITNIIKISKDEIELRTYKKTNNGKKWTRNDIEVLFDELKKESYSIKNIALKLKRKETAIQIKINMILDELLNVYCIDVDVIYKIINLPKNEILCITNITNSESSKPTKENKNKLNNNEITILCSELRKRNSISNIAIILNHSELVIKNKIINILDQLINIYKINIDIITENINITKEEINNYLYPDNNIIITNSINVDPIILNEDQQKILNVFKNKKNIFITGPAGTGKSITIKKIIEYCINTNINYGVTATTGAAALLINGRTIHSYLGIGISNKTPKELFNHVRYKFPHIMKKIRNLEVLIIDEISMMSSEFFDNISKYLSICRTNILPFGNIQIVLTGDFCQLESVSGDYCFNSESWTKLKLEIIYLSKMIRQNNDKNFQKILRELRYGICSDKTYDILSKCINTTFTNIKPTILYPKNIDVDKINNDEYIKLINDGSINKQYPIIYSTDNNKTIIEQTKKWIKSLDIPETINLCIDAQVVITTNITPILVNGTRGKVIELFTDKIIIELINGELIPIHYYKSIYTENTNLFFWYMPLKLAYALTIHKSQGMTLDAIEIDIGNNIFASGQAYTAISRAKDLKNIKITALSKNSFIIKDQVIDFYSQIDPKLKIN
uniref:AAA+ ATPase domain-containing protein n=1 Tax=viral metagenome TaxID=1070528 RepID=A0A6C0H7A7_9ZZZZ